MQPAVTVYASIGNSDDKLTQARWSEFHGKVNEAVRDRARVVYGDWLSRPDDPWQNGCIAFGIDAEEAPVLKGELCELAAKFGQESIAWAVVPETEFIGPAEPERQPSMEAACRDALESFGMILYRRPIGYSVARDSAREDIEFVFSTIEQVADFTDARAKAER